MNKIIALTTAFLISTLSAFAAETTPPSTTVPTEKPACCQRAEKKGKTCTNACCVAAAKEGKVCEKCLKKGHGKKKHKEASAPEKAPEVPKAAQ